MSDIPTGYSPPPSHCFMTYKEEAESLRKQLAAAYARADKLEGKLALAEAQLCDVAEIAHKGGLMNLTESDALIAIRRATLKRFNAAAIGEEIAAKEAREAAK